MADNSQDDKKRVQPELGSLGVKLDFDSFYKDSLRELKFPYSVMTYDQMAADSVIASTLAAINTIASQVEFFIEPYDQSDTHKFRAEFLEQCLFKDMKTSFANVVKDFLTVNQYGFCVLEKVFRFRRKQDGSNFDDGRVGIKYLPLRSQRSIEGFKYDSLNREITHIIQKNCKDKNLTSKDTIELPIDRVMLFRVDPTPTYPYGKSPLANSYVSWRALEKLKSIEAVSANRNLNGIPLLKLPSEVMDESSEDESDKARVRKLKKGAASLAAGEQTYVMLPSDRYDQADGGTAQYEFSVVTGSSSHLTALNSIISRYKNETFQAMCADILTIDDGQSASSSLTSNKQTMFNMFVEARLNEFLDVLNSDLIPDLFYRNGWGRTRLPKLKHGRIEKLTVAELAKAIQQLAATRTIPITPDNTNYIMELFGFPYRVDKDTSFEDLVDILGFNLNMPSKSGSGMEVGTVGDGSAKTVTGTDRNANNLSKS